MPETCSISCGMRYSMRPVESSCIVVPLICEHGEQGEAGGGRGIVRLEGGEAERE